LLLNQQQVFRLKSLDIDQVVASTSRNYAAGKAVTLSLVAAGLTVGAIVTGGALGGMAATVGASAGAAWGTAAYIAGATAVGAMGGAGAAGISKMIKIGFVATVEARSLEQGFWAGLGCSFAKESYIQGPSYVKSMMYGAAVGGIIGAAATGIPLAITAVATNAGVSATTTAIALKATTATVGVTSSSYAAAKNYQASKEADQAAIDLNTAADDAESRREYLKAEKLRDEALRQNTESAFAKYEMGTSIVGGAALTLKVSQSIKMDFKKLKVSRMTPKEFRKFLLKNKELSKGMSAEQLRELTPDQRAIYAQKVLNDNGVLDKNLEKLVKSGRLKDVLDEAHKIGDKDRGFYYDAKKERYVSNYTADEIAKKRAVLAAEGLDEKTINTILDFGVAGNPLPTAGTGSMVSSEVNQKKSKTTAGPSAAPEVPDVPLASPQNSTNRTTAGSPPTTGQLTEVQRKNMQVRLAEAKSRVTELLNQKAQVEADIRQLQAQDSNANAGKIKELKEKIKIFDERKEMYRKEVVERSGALEVAAPPEPPPEIVPSDVAAPIDSVGKDDTAIHNNATSTVGVNNPNGNSSNEGSQKESTSSVYEAQKKYLADYIINLESASKSDPQLYKRQQKARDSYQKLLNSKTPLAPNDLP
jgi:hypothetical protein